MANANEFSQQIDYLNGGPLEKTWGPYPTKEAACLAIENKVDAEGRNMRLGKIVAIGVAQPYVLYWWKDEYRNEDLVEYLPLIKKELIPGVNHFNGQTVNIRKILPTFSVEPVAVSEGYIISAYSAIPSGAKTMLIRGLQNYDDKRIRFTITEAGAATNPPGYLLSDGVLIQIPQGATHHQFSLKNPADPSSNFSGVSVEFDPLFMATGIDGADVSPKTLFPGAKMAGKSIATTDQIPVLSTENPNLFKVGNIIPDKVITIAYVIQTEVGAALSGYIPVSEGFPVTINLPEARNTRVQYSKSDQTINADTPGADLGNGSTFTIIPPAKTGYINFIIGRSGVTPLDVSKITVYQSVVNKLNSLPIKASLLSDNATKAGKNIATEDQVLVKSITFSDDNLFKASDILDNTVINNGDFLIGAIGSSTGNAVSNYMSVSAGQDIELSGFPIGTPKSVAYLTPGKINVVSKPGERILTSPQTFSIPEGCTIMAFTWKRSGDTVDINNVKAIRRTVKKINGAAISDGSASGNTDNKVDYPVLLPLAIYTVCNNVKTHTYLDHNENFSIALYLDHLLSLQMGQKIHAYFVESGRDFFRFFSQITFNDALPDRPLVYNGGVSVRKTTKVLNIEGDLIRSKMITINQTSTLATIGADNFIREIVIGDSNSDKPSQASIGADLTGPVWAQEWIAAFHKRDQIDSGSTLKHRYIAMGLRNKRSFTYRYKGNDYQLTTCTQGHSGWKAVDFNLYSRSRSASQGLWDLLGLGNGTGTDYIAGNIPQLELMYNTPEGKYTPVNTPALLSYMGVATYAEALTKADNELTNPENPFFDRSLTGNTRFSLAKYVERYKTLEDDGVTRLVVGSTAGTLVTNVNSHDLCAGINSVYLQLGTNDAEGGSWYLNAINSITSQIKAYNPAALVSFGCIDYGGTYFPKFYPEIECESVNGANLYASYANHNRVREWNRQLMTIQNEANKMFYVPVYFTQPTAYGPPARFIHEAAYLALKEQVFDFVTKDGTVPSPTTHPGPNTQPGFAYTRYSVNKYALSL